MRELRLTLVEQLSEPKQNVGAFGQRRGPPGGERVPGGSDGCVQLFCGGEVDLMGLLAGCRVEDGPGAAGLADHGLPTDPVTDPLQRSRLPSRQRWPQRQTRTASAALSDARCLGWHLMRRACIALRRTSIERPACTRSDSSRAVGSASIA